MTPPLRLAPVLVAALAFVACGERESKPTDSGTAPPAGAGKADGGYSAGNPGYAAQGGKVGAAAAGALDPALEKRVDAALGKGRQFLVAAQTPEGSFGDPAGQIPPSVGYTAMAATALVGATPSTQVASDERITKALAYLASKQKEDGSVFDNPQYVNYMTSAAVGAFTASRLPAYAGATGKARDFLVASQIVGDEDDLNHGAFPYHSKSPRPADLSNVQFAATALAEAGLPKDHVVWRRIEAYLAKVQNRSERNKIKIERDVGQGVQGTVVSGDDGGSAYAPGLSYADWEKKEDGTYVPRSYGSMTYALLKCLILAGVDPKDPRVVAALGWIAQNFAVDRNPGMPAERAGQAYYYYLFTAARTLAEYERATKKPLEVVDAGGRKHDWRAEMAEALLSRQAADGSWVNEQDERWEEGSKVLATSYAMQSLAVIKGRL
jgi:squalene-hopene/tetraprenyl-beta-curcumene cyclase